VHGMRVNVLGNGDHSWHYKRGTEGKLLICNMPPFEIPRNEVHASCMVDFKMMMALQEGIVNLDMYDWVLGTRPRKWMEMQPNFYLKYSQNIRSFWQRVPEYAGNATNFSCGHMAVDYACAKMNATEVHLYGFDSIFDMTLLSATDLILESDRSINNTHRIANNWRPIWPAMFSEYSHVKFYLHHSHDKAKIPLPENVEIVVTTKKKGG
jgi:hypothetical protein